MPENNISCTVTNCHYWGGGDVCRADRIEVGVSGSRNARMDAGRFPGDQATTSENTCCVTFKPRG